MQPLFCAGTVLPSPAQDDLYQLDHLSHRDMGSPKDSDVFSRGTKRKHSGDAGTRTFAQRLAAARKAPRRAESETDLDAPEDLGRQDRQEPPDSPDAERDGTFRSLYAGDIDFAALAEKDSRLGAHLKHGRHLDFTDPVSVMQLTKTLLKVDFDLDIELPSDRLCPPVPNRHNYILWIKELLDSTSPSYSDTYEPGRKVTGLDIGTGASAIYPLLGCAQRRSWTFIATDIDQESLRYARKNVGLNSLESRVRVVERSPEAPLIPLDELSVDAVEFVMTNPPFYSSESELLELARQKSKPPNSACTGAPNEMVCDGGEVGFFRRIFEESLVLRERVQWYTTMLGKQSSLDAIIELLHKHDIDNYAVTEFVQGSKTRRWAVGWSFVGRRPNTMTCRGFEPSAGKKLLPPLTEITAASKTTKKGGGGQFENIFWTQLEDVTDGLDLRSWNLDEDRLRVVGFADQNVWGRAYRRSRARGGPAEKLSKEPSGKEDGAVSECIFGFSISVRTQKDQPQGKEVVSVVVRWLQGRDYALFESFAGMLRNTLLNVVS